MTQLSVHHPLRGVTADAILIDALRSKRPERTPVWWMRQAGRSLPEYRAIRETVSMLDACVTPDIAAEITVQPVRRHGVDAGIFFSDIVVPLHLVGVEVDIVPGVGPVMGQAYRSAAQIAELTRRAIDPAQWDPIRQAVAIAVAELGAIPLMGFAGAPFTVAAYLVEGRPSKDHLVARTLMHTEPRAWHALLSWVADLTGQFLRAQIEAGASAGQLFDSWAGALSTGDYAQHAAPASVRALRHVADLGAPIIHFGTSCGHLLPLMRNVLQDAGIQDFAMGIDYRIPLDDAAQILGPVPLQGNIDPARLATPWPILEDHARDVLRRGRAAPAHVVNLGHGVPPSTNPDVLTRLVDLIHQEPG